MNKPTKIQVVSHKIVRMEGARSFAVIGDPGCEGVGASMMQVYANALTEASRDDFILVAGDLVPIGTARHYQTACEVTEAVSQKDVFVLRGNHDTGAYSDYFGRQDYAIACDGFTIVVVDNAARTFSQKGLDLLGRVLADRECRCVVIAFHIPLPNRFTGNAVSQEEFDRLRAVYEPYREKVQAFVCGHVHSRFEDVVDGVPFVCTGGGGAMIEDVSDDIRAEDVNHHIVRFAYEEGRLRYEFVDLGAASYRREYTDPILSDRLMQTVQAELFAHLRYLTFAERAQKRGCARVANLFRALAESEYRHARSFYAILDQSGPFAEAVGGFVPEETFEYEKLYPMLEDYAAEHKLPLSRQAYRDAAAAEKVHAGLLSRAQSDGEEESQTLYVCSVCGYLMEGEQPDRCPVCGAPSRQFEVFEAQ